MMVSVCNKKNRVAYEVLKPQLICFVGNQI